MNPKSDLICLSHLRWGFVFQRPNHLMTRCARERRTYFWEEPLADVAEDGAPFVDVRCVAHNLHLVTPHVRPGRDGQQHTRTQRELLDRMMEDHDIREPILWFYTPMALAFSDHVKASAIVYDSMDELSNFHGAPRELREREMELFARAGLVFTGGRSLYEAKKHHHPRVTAFPSSVDSAHFAKSRDEHLTEALDQQPIKRPRLGFFGVIDERIDLALLAAVADARPDWQIVMVGPVVKIQRESLPVRPNIHYLGPKKYEELPEYLTGWDVALMPFALNDATRFISPTKTLEYLAAGVPVVSTPIADVVNPYGELDLVRIGTSHASFIAQVEAALAEPREPRRSIADAYVAGTSWDETWRAMAVQIESIVHHGARRAGGRMSIARMG